MKLYVVENIRVEDVPSSNNDQQTKGQKDTPDSGRKRGRRAGKVVGTKQSKTKQDDVIPIIKLKTFKTGNRRRVRRNARLRLARSFQTQPNRGIMSPFAANTQRTTIANANIERNIHQPKAGPSTMKTVQNKWLAVVQTVAVINKPKKHLSIKYAASTL